MLPPQLYPCFNRALIRVKVRCRSYAMAICELLDPMKELFGQRVIAQVSNAVTSDEKAQANAAKRLLEAGASSPASLGQGFAALLFPENQSVQRSCSKLKNGSHLGSAWQDAEFGTSHNQFHGCLPACRQRLLEPASLHSPNVFWLGIQAVDFCPQKRQQPSALDSTI